MASTPTVEELSERLTRLERVLAAGTAPGGKARALSNGRKQGVGRRELLKMAGLAAAASAGAALITSTNASAADGSNVILGGSGDTSNPNLAEHPTEVHLDGSVTPTPGVILLANDTTFMPSQAAYPAAVAGWGNTRNGVYGVSVSSNGIVGITNTTVTSAAAGVLGIGSSGAGVGVSGQSGASFGVSGFSSAGAGVAGTSNSNVGGFFSGGRAPISLNPSTTAGPPSSGSHSKGDVWVDTNGIVWICTVAGTPGTFVPVLEGSRSGDTNNPNLTSLATEVKLDGSVSPPPGVIFLANDTAFKPGDALYPAAVAGWGNTRSGVYGVSFTNFGVVGVSNGGSTGAGVIGSAGNGVGGSFLGGRAPINLNPATTAGPPSSGSHSPGDVWVDTNGAVWICTVFGTPGTFVPLQQGGLNNAIFTAVSTAQYTLPNSDGVSWVDLDTTNLKLTITPKFNCQAIISGNSDLWTSVAGFNQDLAIFISGGTYGTGQVVAWKESGGFAGTFSPNAAFVQTVQPLAAGTTYTLKLQWKANRGGSSTIWAGAGPIPAGSTTFSPTRLTAFLVMTA